MKQFLYLDTDIVNSIIAQSEKGIITGFSTEEENGEQKSTNKSISGNLEGDAGGKLLKVFNAELKLDIRGGIGTEKEVHSASREIITKTLHDAAFDIAYDSINHASLIEYCCAGNRCRGECCKYAGGSFVWHTAGIQSDLHIVGLDQLAKRIEKRL